MTTSGKKTCRDSHKVQARVSTELRLHDGATTVWNAEGVSRLYASVEQGWVLSRPIQNSV